MLQPTRRQQRARERHARVRGWRYEKLADTKEAQIAAAWRAHREYLRSVVETEGSNKVAAISNSRGVSEGNKEDHEANQIPSSA
jgi:hypothetical protein